MENQYYRTFIGVPVRVGPRFLAARRELMRALEGERISWVSPDIYHVTIRFIGDTHREKIGQIGFELQERVPVPALTSLRLEGPGLFGPRKNPRVIWLGFGDDSVLRGLRDPVDDALVQCGIPRQEQPFRAHLTLGRIRSLRDSRNLYDLIERMQGRFGEEVLADRMVFYRSELGRGGPVYTPIRSFEFVD